MQVFLQSFLAEQILRDGNFVFHQKEILDRICEILRIQLTLISGKLKRGGSWRVGVFKEFMEKNKVKKDYSMCVGQSEWVDILEEWGKKSVVEMLPILIK